MLKTINSLTGKAVFSLMPEQSNDANLTFCMSLKLLVAASFDMFSPNLCRLVSMTQTYKTPTVQQLAPARP